MKYRINWTELVGYYTEIEANSADEAHNAFMNGEHDSCEPDGFCETETDSIEVTPLDSEGKPMVLDS